MLKWYEILHYNEILSIYWMTLVSGLKTTTTTILTTTSELIKLRTYYFIVVAWACSLVSANVTYVCYQNSINSL